MNTEKILIDGLEVDVDSNLVNESEQPNGNKVIYVVYHLDYDYDGHSSIDEVEHAFSTLEGAKSWVNSQISPTSFEIEEINFD